MKHTQTLLTNGFTEHANGTLRRGNYLVSEMYFNGITSFAIFDLSGRLLLELKTVVDVIRKFDENEKR